MFDEQLGLYNENSLDILIRFNSSNQQEEDYASTHLFSTPSKDLPQTQEFIQQPFEPNVSLSQTSYLPQTEAQIEKMRKVCFQQQKKVEKMMEVKQRCRPKVALNTKRKVSECTEAPNSPLKKTKLVKKMSSQ